MSASARISGPSPRFQGADETPPARRRTRSASLQKSQSPETFDTSIQLARAALASPSRRSRSPAPTAAKTAAALKIDIGKRLRSDLPDYLALHNLTYHVGKKVNVVGLATTDSPPPVRTKTRQSAVSFHVTDPGTAPVHVFEVQVYRAHRDSLPVVKAGDGLVLRNFDIVALPKKGFGLRSRDDSSYAVFEHPRQSDDDEPPPAPLAPQINGPPVEDLETEAQHVAHLGRWFAALDGDAREKLRKADEKLSSAASPKK